MNEDIRHSIGISRDQVRGITRKGHEATVEGKAVVQAWPITLGAA
jgi:hypothetical protein